MKSMLMMMIIIINIYQGINTVIIIIIHRYSIIWSVQIQQQSS